jgi:hypothetical protein
MGAMVHLRQAGNKRSLQVAADVVNSVTSLLDALEHVKIDDADDAENQKEALIGLILEQEPSQPAADASVALRKELEAISRVSALKKRAREAGVEEQKIDDADDAENQKEALIGLILEQEPSQPAVCSVPSRPLLPDGKHAMLSYQWNVQEEVKHIEEMLKKRNVKCWMDIDGGMKNDIYDSMAEGVQDAACLICFMTQAYQGSVNCKLELKFAQQSGVPIIPVMMQANFAAKGWLAILTAGSIWTPMHDRASVPDGVDNLITQVQHVLRGGDDDADTHSEGSSDAGSAFDVGAWGDEMFSLEETRDELERLRAEVAPLTAKHASAPVGELCPLPAMVPTLARGLFVTTEMQSVLDAVLLDTSTPQIGFCGMGGIGKTTVSCWVTRDDAVRRKFGMVAWVTLGQTPMLESCMDLLHMQLTGSALPEGVAIEQTHEMLQHALLNKSVLLILDDCWDADVAKHFNWIDQSTNSKILISSRIRDVLDGGQIIDIAAPSKTDAVKMLLSTAGMDVGALESRKEVAQIAELCKRLPLTIGVAGKLIRQLANGSEMSESSEWTEVVALLEDEMNDQGSVSVEESVIRASIRSIPKKIQPQVTQLFLSFALAAEDTLVPLPVLGMVFDACGSPSKSGKSAKPLSRMQVRRYLKILIDRSLVLGTVDRPQLHDVMLDYVQKELAGDQYMASQRRLVESLRTSDRSASTPTGRYIQQHVPHHIKESYDVTWGRSKQAISWLEDHVGGVQDIISASTASILTVEVLAKEAEEAGMWWQGALRWKAFGLLKAKEAGALHGGTEYLKLALATSAKAADAILNNTVDPGVQYTQSDLDMFDLKCLNSILKSWDPAQVAIYGERYRKALATDAGRSQPLICYGGTSTLDMFPALVGGNMQSYANETWKLAELVLDRCDPQNIAMETDGSDEGGFVLLLKPMLSWHLNFSGDAIMNAPGFSWDRFGPDGDKLVDYYNVYDFAVHHAVLVDIISFDVFAVYGGTQWVLTMQYGRVAEVLKMNEDNLRLTEKIMANTADNGYIMDFYHSACMLSRVYHMHGLPSHVDAHFKTLGLTFENAEERLGNVTKPMHGTLIAPYGHKGAGGGVESLTTIVWQVKALCILNMDVPESQAIAWLDSLPDNETIYEYCMTFPTHDFTSYVQLYQPCWIALVHEKFSLFDGALRFVDLQLEPDPLKAGNPLNKWPQVIALACKGRVLAKLNRHDEALVAFQAAIAVSKQSYNMMEALAYRELANYAAGGVAAVQAGVDLEAKMKTFEGRVTREEFDALRI